MKDTKLINRQVYLDRALAFRDTDLIKVITGVRRCGKSSLLELVRRAIESEEVAGRGFAYLNLESMSCDVETPQDMYGYFSSRLSPDGRTYVFIDEPQRIKGWETAVNAMRVDFDCDIYLTGSNAYLLSSELSTYLSGRYVEIKMLPLSLAEYLDFNGIEFKEGSSVALRPNGDPVLFDDVFGRYLTYGGMPAIASLETAQPLHEAYMSSLYDAVATRDVLNRERALGASKVTNPALLQRIAVFLSDNVGNRLSSSKVAGTLTSAGAKTTNKTVDSYVRALNDAYLFYRADRYDLHGRGMLVSSPKQYIVDLGLRSFLDGYRGSNSGRAFENAVYLQLLFEGWSVHVGKIYNEEVDFVATRDGRTVCIQATDKMDEKSTLKRELGPLRTLVKMPEKIVVVNKSGYPPEIDGIRIICAREFFLGHW